MTKRRYTNLIIAALIVLLVVTMNKVLSIEEATDEVGETHNISVVLCLYFLCDKEHQSSISNRTHHIQKELSTVELCAGFAPTHPLRAVDMCHSQLKADHKLIAMELSPNIFISVRTTSKNVNSRLPITMLTWMQAVQPPQQVSSYSA